MRLEGWGATSHIPVLCFAHLTNSYGHLCHRKLMWAKRSCTDYFILRQLIKTKCIFSLVFIESCLLILIEHSDSEGSQFPFFFFLILFIYFWFCWVSVAARGLSLVVASGGYSSLRCVGFSLRWLLLLQSMGSRCAGFSSCGSWAQ